MDIVVVGADLVTVGAVKEVHQGLAEAKRRLTLCSRVIWSAVYNNRAAKMKSS